MKKLFDLLETSTLNDFKNNIKIFITSLGLKDNLSALGLSKEDITKILEKDFNIERLGNNPRKIYKTDIVKIFESIYC